MSNLADWNIFTQIVSVTELCIAGYCLYRFVKPFLQSRKTALATGGVYFLTMFLLYVAPLHMDVFTAYALGSVIAFFVMWILEQQGYVCVILCWCLSLRQAQYVVLRKAMS